MLGGGVEGELAGSSLGQEGLVEVCGDHQPGNVGGWAPSGDQDVFRGVRGSRIVFSFGYVYNILSPGLRLALTLGEVSMEAGLSSLSQGVTHRGVS